MLGKGQMDKAQMDKVVQKLVSRVLERHMENLREELTRSVLEELDRERDKAGKPGSAATDGLFKAVSAIHAVTAQRDVLRALIDSTAPYSGRTALFVIKGGTATGWHGHGVSDSIKDFSLDLTALALVRVLNSRQTFAGSSSEMDGKFISQFGGPADPACVIVPLILKEKVAAIIYADSGHEQRGALDRSALELLVLVTATWLEVTAGRKPAGREAGHESDVPIARGAAAQAGGSFSDPFAAHAPAFSHATAVTADVERIAAGARANLSGISEEDADVHRKAQRFARLLVDEIKLYNQAKLLEGRKHKDLYDRLKEDIEKSRATYQKRYGSTVAGSADYFGQEMIRSLAEDDVVLLGSNFPGYTK